MPIISLDTIDGVSVDYDEFLNECRSLMTLRTGLILITENVKRQEVAWQECTGGKVKFHVYGLDIDGTKGDLDLIACFFHWFGVSICNYARLVGFVRGLSTNAFTRADLADSAKFESIGASVRSYTANLPGISDVFVWRNKVAAHFAATAPKKGANPSTLDMSVVFPVTFTNGQYRVGELMLTRMSATGTHTSAIPCWSVTEVFERLLPRYWPDIKVRSPEDKNKGPEGTTLDSPGQHPGEPGRNPEPSTQHHNPRPNGP
jgi:hypothetical protein